LFSKAGQERFRSVTHSYYRDAHALLLLYDVTSYSSFENISSWLSEIKESTHNDIIIMLIGNKVDKSQRVVSREAGERLARDFQISFLETSAKTGQNVELAFMATAQALLDKTLNETNAHLSLNDLVKTHNTETSSSCC
jgi:small GTP-binding protein